MSLRIIYGRAGSGKSSFCINDMREQLQGNADKPLILIVPEQFSLQAEKKLVKIIKNDKLEATYPVILEVLSFRRMAHRVLNEVGGITKKHISSAGKSMIISRILDENTSELRVFSKAAKQVGFINTISDMISEFKRYNVTPEKLMESAKSYEEGNLLKYKLQDLALIYGAFEETIKKDYLDVDDDLTLLSEKLDQSEFLNGAEIWIDEFSGFTPQEYSVVEGLLKKASRVNICLCTDCLVDERESITSITDVFSPIRNTAKKLIRLANKNGIEIERPVSLKFELEKDTEKDVNIDAEKDAKKDADKEKQHNHYRGRHCESEELRWLENKLFSFPIVPYKKDENTKAESISIFAAENIYTEVEGVARDIVSMCRDGGLRYKDITVVAGILDDYDSLVRAIFTEYEIPFFIDKKKDIMGNPLMVMILSALEIFIKNWSYESVFRYLKTGLTNVDLEDIDVIENYVLACGIRGSAWTSDNKWGDERKTEKNERPEKNSNNEDVENSESIEKNENNEEAGASLNEIRLSIVTPLLKYRERTKGSRKIRDVCTALYDLLCDIGVIDKINERIEYYKNSGQLSLANEYGQIWNILMELLDQTVKISENDSVTIQKFYDLLFAGAADYKIGLIPPSIDGVLVGSVDRSKSHETKALYILGVNDGVFPAVDKQEGILSDIDRERLRETGVELAPDTTAKIFEEQFKAYSILSSSSCFLKLSYPVADIDGKALRPSYILHRLKKLFPDINEKVFAGSLNKGSSSLEKNILDIEEIAAAVPAFNGLVGALRQQADGNSLSPLWKDTYKWFSHDEKWKARLDSVVNGLSYSNQVKPISREKARKLYGSPMYSSISRMEQYVSCPYSYYIKYGIKAEERKIFSLRAPDVGTFIHEILEGFTKKVHQSELEWNKIEREWCEDTVDSITDEFMKKSSGSVFTGTERSKYIVKRLKRVITRAVWLIAQHIAKSAFNPFGFEVSFGENGDLPPITITLSNGEEVRLVGRIDRVDMMQSDNGTYVRIIDYKSGNKGFNLSEIYHGLDIQLISYLDALIENKGGKLKNPIIPAGVLYFSVDDPIIKSVTLKDEREIEKKIMKKLRMKGLVLADVDIVKAMDIDINGDSLLIPVRLNKGDVLSGTSSAATVEQFEILRKHVKNLLVKLGDEMLSGNASIKPYKKKKFTSCAYCDYASVCQFDPMLKDNEFRILDDKKDEEVWKIIREFGARSSEFGENE